MWGRGSTGHGGLRAPSPLLPLPCFVRKDPELERGARVPRQAAALVLRAAAPRLAPSRGPDSQRGRLALGGAGTCCLNVNTSFIHLDWLSSAMLRYT